MDNDKPKVYQIQGRVEKIMSVNDALTQGLFSLSADEFKKLIEGEERKFLESKTKKHGCIESRYWLKPIDTERVKVSRPLGEFDRAILDACITAQQEGYELITPRGLWRAITGEQGDNVKLTPEMEQELIERADNLACLRITVDVSDACKKGIYPPDTKVKIRGSLLPCTIIECIVNGQLVEAAICFDRESPLVRVAQARNGKQGAAQILTYPLKLISTPQRNTPTTIAVKNYLVRRVEAAIGNPKLARCIRLATLYGHCGLANAGWWQKQDARRIAESVMKSLVDSGAIKSFAFEKEKGAVYKITFEP